MYLETDVFVEGTEYSIPCFSYLEFANEAVIIYDDGRSGKNCRCIAISQSGVRKVAV
jgi:hypothetical protein